MATLKQESINQFEGFGNDNKLTRGEYYRSSGFTKSQNGIRTGGFLGHLMNSYTLTDLGNATPISLAYARAFAVATQTPSNYLFCSDANGGILQSQQGSVAGEYAHRGMVNNHVYFGHLITDPKGRLLYHQDRYLGMFDGTGATTNYITGTVTVTNGSTAVVGSGTTFTAGMVGKAFRIAGDTKFYLVATYTDATHITINTYTGTTGSGKSYVINTQWDDSWKDFGASVTLPNGDSPKCPMDIYEDTVIFGRGSVITTLNVLTDTVTTDASPSLSLPAGYSIEHIVSNSNGILIAGNVRSKGFVLLWDNLSDRAIAPWIWFPDSILSVCKSGSDWIITTTKGFTITNGYSTTPLTQSILGSSYDPIITSNPKSTVVIDNAIHFFGYSSDRSLKRNVLYRMDLTTKLVEAFPRYDLNQGQYSITQMEYVSEAKRLFVCLGGSSTESGIDYLYTKTAPTCSTYITSQVGQGANLKVAKRVKIRIRRNTNRISSLLDAMSFKIAVKIADCKHTLYGFSQVGTTSTLKNTITLNNTGQSFNTPKVGYEVEFVGDNYTPNTGYARNVTAVTGAGTSSEVWTLDEDFPSLPVAGQNVTITPFQLVKRKTVTVTDGEVQELIFEVKNSIKSDKFMIKVDIEANSSALELELEPLIFIYEDLGTL